MTGINELINQIGHFMALTEYLKPQILSNAMPQDITPIQNSIINAVLFNDNASITSISKALNMSKSNCSREVKKLMDKNYLRKDVVHSDKRLYTISLTTAGKKKYFHSIEAIHDNIKRMLVNLDDDEIEILTAGFKNLSEIINKSFKYE